MFLILFLRGGYIFICFVTSRQELRIWKRPILLNFASSLFALDMNILSLSLLTLTFNVNYKHRMIPPLGREHSHEKTHYISGKQILVRSWQWKIYIIYRYYKVECNNFLVSLFSYFRKFCTGLKIPFILYVYTDHGPFCADMLKSWI